MTVVIVTGTSTGVGKTVVTAALARNSLDAGRRVGVVKPVQSGAASGEPADVAVIERLSGVSGRSLVTLADPLAPDTAARLRGLDVPSARELAARTVAVAQRMDVLYVEGAGGVLVRLDRDGGTLLTLARIVLGHGLDVEVVIVTSLALGTLNHTELTVGAVRAAGLEPAGLMLGDVPEHLGLAERVNVDELPRVTGLPVIGSVPHGVGDWPGLRFQRACGGWLTRPF